MGSFGLFYFLFINLKPRVTFHSQILISEEILNMHNQIISHNISRSKIHSSTQIIAIQLMFTKTNDVLAPCETAKLYIMLTHKFSKQRVCFIYTETIFNFL